MSYESERAAIIEVGRRMYQVGLVTATEGNVSVRVAEGHLVTASGVSKGFLSDEHVVLIDHEGRPAPGGHKASVEDPMHLAIYRSRKDVQAVVHAHPPTATAFAVAHAPLDPRILAESVVVLGDIPLIPYAMPGTTELADMVAQGLANGATALLANHGAITVGRTLTQAHHRMEALEHLARVTMMARVLGGTRQIPDGDVARLLAATSGAYR